MPSGHASGTGISACAPPRAYSSRRASSPRGYGRNTSAFEMLTDAEASVEFDVGDDGSVRGMGVRWEDFPERSEGSIEERAQVWFRRVGA
jgi:hypothetical protein